MKKLLSMSLQEIFLDYVNDFLSLERMAEYYGVEYSFMKSLYEQSRELYNKVYP